MPQGKDINEHFIWKRACLHCQQLFGLPDRDCLPEQETLLMWFKYKRNLINQVRDEPDGDACLNCGTVCFNSMGGISIKEANKLCEQSQEFETKFDELRRKQARGAPRTSFLCAMLNLGLFVFSPATRSMHWYACVPWNFGCIFHISMPVDADS